MMIAVMVSNKPATCEKIASGACTILVRKTRPKIDAPFKCYIYCTNSNGMLLAAYDGLHYSKDYVGRFDPACINCKVIGEFVCDKIDKFELDDEFFGKHIEYDLYNTEVSKTCLTRKELREYGKGEPLYGWHITDLVIYDEPKELSEFKYHCKYELYYDFKHCSGCDYHYYSNTPSSGIEEYCTCDGLKTLIRPPQSWCYVKESIDESNNG